MKQFENLPRFVDIAVLAQDNTLLCQVLSECAANNITDHETILSLMILNQAYVISDMNEQLHKLRTELSNQPCRFIGFVQ